MINIIFILIILFLVLIIILYKNNKKKEQFVSEINNEPILKLNVIDTKIPILTIYKNEYDISIKLNLFITGIAPATMTKRKFEYLVDGGLNMIRMGI